MWVGHCAQCQEWSSLVERLESAVPPRLGIGAVRASTLGRAELASRLHSKQERVRERLS